MPTYEYECGGCGYTFERFQSMTAKQIRTCPECRQRKIKRLIGTGAGLIFKGSGFYETDYRSEGYKKAAKKEQEGTSGKKSDKSDKSDKSKKTNNTGKSSDSKAKNNSSPE